MTELTEDTSRRFDVELFIIHPTIDPAEITATLGLEGHVIHRVGDTRKTPKGTVLSGTYPDTRWRHCVEHTVEGQWFARQLAEFIAGLVAHKQFLAKLRASGGRASVIIQFLGHGYFGDQVSMETLARLVDLESDFAIECFSEPQSG